jgi:pimeloyl-ACP methyl ester carboxylesterase
MDFMAETVHYCLKHEMINNIILLGHSMGGYVSLAFAEKYPEMLSGLGLIHSAPFSDTDEKKEIRTRETELIKSGKKNVIFALSIPNLYACHNQESFKNSIDISMKIAMKTADQGIIAALKGMKIKPDRSNVINNLKIPVFMMIGTHDNLIPAEKLIAFAEENKNIQKIIMSNSGHMSFFEEKEQFLKKIKKFITFIQ